MCSIWHVFTHEGPEEYTSQSGFIATRDGGGCGSLKP